MIFSIIFRYKKILLLLALAAFVVSSLVSLVLPPRYVASASFLPAGVEQEITGNRGFFSQMGAFGEAYASFLRVRRNFVVDYLVRSRTMSDLLSERFRLEEVYGVRGGDEVRRVLRERTSVEVKDEGVILIDVVDRSPLRAKSIVEAYIQNVDSMLVAFTVAGASEKTRFLEQEIERRERRIAELDSAIARYMEDHGLFAIERQAEAALEVVSKIRARLSMFEVEKQLLEMTVKTGTPKLERIEREMEKLRDQIRVLKDGSGEDDELFTPLSRIPELAAGYIRLMSERNAQEFALSFVRLNLENERITAGKKVSVIRLIDPPIVPERRIWPKRKQIVIVSTFSVIIWSCFFLVLREQRRERSAARRDARCAGAGGAAGASGEGGGGEPWDP